jgi:hypothetical protein
LNQQQKARQELDIAATANQQKILLVAFGKFTKTKKIGVGFAAIAPNVNSNN